jgi:hypothetical protein
VNAGDIAMMSRRGTSTSLDNNIGYRHSLGRWARLLIVLAVGLVCGCAGEAPPAELAATHRDAIRLDLQRLGARVTSDSADGLYLSLRNTHVEIRDLGGVVEGTRGTRNDIRDFYLVNEAVAKNFIEAGEVEKFKSWFRTSLSPSSTTVPRTEFGELTLTLSRSPLRSVFSRKELLAEE